MNTTYFCVSVTLTIMMGSLVVWFDRAWPQHTTAQDKLRRKLEQAETRWQQQGYIIHWGATHVTYHGNQLPLGKYEIVHPAVGGVLGLVDNVLIYERDKSSSQLIIPLADIQWIGSHNVRVKLEDFTTVREGLIIHYVQQRSTSTQWRIAIFIAADFYPILKKLSKLTALPYYRLERQRPDFGPFDAIRMEQDIYGKWHRQHNEQLYITPTSQLVFGFRDPLPVNQLRHIEVIKRSSKFSDFIPYSTALLRLGYEDLGQRHTVGYLMRDADALAQQLSARSGVPHHTDAGRKKK